MLDMLLEQRIAYVDLDHLEGYLRLYDLRVFIEELIHSPEDLILRKIDQVFRDIFDH